MIVNSIIMLKVCVILMFVIKKLTNSRIIRVGIVTWYLSHFYFNVVIHIVAQIIFTNIGMDNINIGYLLWFVLKSVWCLFYGVFIFFLLKASPSERKKKTKNDLQRHWLCWNALARLFTRYVILFLFYSF